MSAARTLPREALALSVDPAVLAQLEGRYDAFWRAAAPMRPKVHSTESRQLQARALEITLPMLRGLRAMEADGFRRLIDEQLRSLMQAEFSSDDITRKFALAQLRQAVRVYATSTQLVATVLRTWNDATVRGFLDGLSDLEPSSLVEASPEWSALTLGVCVALECAGDAVELAHLCHWSSFAASAARDVEAELPELKDALETASVVLKAKGAWDDWDAQDIQDELDAWQKFAP